MSRWFKRTSANVCTGPFSKSLANDDEPSSATDHAHGARFSPARCRGEAMSRKWGLAGGGGSRSRPFSCRAAGLFLVRHKGHGKGPAKRRLVRGRHSSHVRIPPVTSSASSSSLSRPSPSGLKLSSGWMKGIRMAAPAPAKVSSVLVQNRERLVCISSIAASTILAPGNPPPGPYQTLLTPSSPPLRRSFCPLAKTKLQEMFQKLYLKAVAFK
jgi:hypothetical protein